MRSRNSESLIDDWSWIIGRQIFVAVKFNLYSQDQRTSFSYIIHPLRNLIIFWTTVLKMLMFGTLREPQFSLLVKLNNASWVSKKKLKLEIGNVKKILSAHFETLAIKFAQYRIYVIIKAYKNRQLIAHFFCQCLYLINALICSYASIWDFGIISLRWALHIVQSEGSLMPKMAKMTKESAAGEHISYLCFLDNFNFWLAFQKLMRSMSR